jgi:hypothetical protein
MVQWISGKAEYTEAEAASALGITIGDLRALVRTHVIKEEAERESAEIPLPSFRPSDLLLLRMLSESQIQAARALAE